MSNMSEKNHTTEIFEYIRRNKSGKKIKVGVILGLAETDVIKIGWSKCNVSQDKFNRERGLELARCRARNETPTTTPVPDCIKRQVRAFGSRAVRYFKEARVVELPV